MNAKPVCGVLKKTKYAYAYTGKGLFKQSLVKFQFENLANLVVPKTNSWEKKKPFKSFFCPFEEFGQ